VIVDQDHRVRMRAIAALPSTEATAFMFRRVLFTDAHAEVRAAAARRITDATWLLEAIATDRSPLVRDSIIRALAACGAGEALPVLRELADTDRTWWVRRAAIYALAALGGAGELPALTAALEDPFWRVRHAAVRVLGVLGERDLDVRAALAEERTDAATYLRASWGPVALEAPQRATSPTTQLPAALLDPDPAVVTARLESAAVTPRALVELLCDPHVALRTLAVQRLVAEGDTAAFIAALDWLDAFKIPHVADTVEAMLDRLAERAVPIAVHALARDDRPHAARWAIRWVAATRYEPLYAAAIVRADADRALRRCALPIASDAHLVTWLGDASLVSAIAKELYDRRRTEARDHLLAIDPTDHPLVLALQLDVRARRGDLEHVAAALRHPHHAPRAVAMRWWKSELGITDRDPAVREAAITVASAPRLAADEDPFVRRAAIEKLAVTYAHAHEVPEDAVAAGVCALADRDPWIRARALDLASHDPAALPAIVAALADANPAGRAAAAEALAELPDADALVTDLLGSAGATSSPAIQTAAVAWLARSLDPAAVSALRALPLAGDARRVLRGVLGEPDAPRTSAPLAAPRATATVEQRRFGRASFAVAPLAISGAFGLPEAALRRAHAAGANLYFWEPAYTEMTRFLVEEPRARVIAGSYHADAASIEADVDRALRRLKRDAIDVFLLFWSRSEARVDAAAHAMLGRLKRSGKVRAIGFSTHQRELARDAITASPWDVVMIRHSAAHPGIEEVLLPVARERGTAIITFSALTYGRMVSGPNAPSAADCYRYSLSQPGVTACISAPRTGDELAENLAVLERAILDDAGLAALRAHGLGVRAENQRFNALLRQPTRDAAAAARELLAAELPPDDEIIVSRPLPRAGQSRGSRTKLR